MSSPSNSPDDPRLGPLLEQWYERRALGIPMDLGALADDPALRSSFEQKIAGVIAIEAALGEPPAPPPPLGVPGRFERLGYYAHGGMGVVYKAWDVELGREVAYKVIKPELAGDRGKVAAFSHEARITASLQHSGVVSVHAQVDDKVGRPAYAMKFLQGKILKEVVAEFHDGKSGPPTRDAWRELVARFVAACRTVQHAHEQKILHRDLSPKNILIMGDETFVVDWGLAWPMGDETTPGPEAPAEYRPPTRAGTPPYAAPEVWDESVSQPFGPRSDVYALGALLYLILTCRAPHGGGSHHELVERTMAGPPPNPRSINPHAPRPLVAVCVKAMARAPGDRYPTAEAMADDVALWLAGERVVADREPWFETTTRWALRHAVAVAASIVGIVLLASASVTWASLSQARVQAREVALRDREAEISLMAKDQYLVSKEEFQTNDPDRDLRLKFAAYQSLLDLLHAEDFDREKAIEAIQGFMARLGDRDPAKPSESQVARVRGPLFQVVALLEGLRHDFPAKVEYRFSLGETYLMLGSIEAITGEGEGEKQAASLGYHDKGRALLEPLIDDPKMGRLARKTLSEVEFGRFANLLTLGRFTEAMIAVDRSISLNPNSPSSIGRPAQEVVLKQAEMEQQTAPWSRPPKADHAHAIAMADYLAGREGVSDKAVYNAACAFSLASVEDKADVAERERRATRAVALLARIAKAGYFADPRWRQELASDADLAPIRGRADFREMARPFLK